MDLERIQRAPLKPQQRLRMLTGYLLPRFLHVWVLGRVNAGALKECDWAIRASVRAWLHLPHDTPTEYFNAAIRDGGLDIPLVSRLVPILRLRRLSRLSNSTACQSALPLLGRTFKSV